MRGQLPRAPLFCLLLVYVVSCYLYYVCVIVLVMFVLFLCCFCLCQGHPSFVYCQFTLFLVTCVMYVLLFLLCLYCFFVVFAFAKGTPLLSIVSLRCFLLLVLCMCCCSSYACTVSLLCLLMPRAPLLFFSDGHRAVLDARGLARTRPISLLTLSLLTLLDSNLPRNPLWT